MARVDIEVCVNTEDSQPVHEIVHSAYIGGTATIELCRALHLGGLTPARQHIVEARTAFPDRPGLMVMVRPRGGDFAYSQREVEIMLRQITIAAECRADGVVFGVLRPDDQRVATSVVQRLIAESAARGLRTTFHRAFDATPDPFEALDILIRLGVDRVLTSGIPWGHPGTALDGVDRLANVIRYANGQIEVVIGGGVNGANIAAILAKVPLDVSKVALHAYSGAQQAGKTTVQSVQAFVGAVNSASP
ncbi:MAG: copper homeostasis protein CutC [Chloroflexota bacterium]|nr:copper homeostasis protein CutC [Chloroflexota bacterium]PLS76874.1 MAG: copper homeostasis protein CutC [Chloroflexota bacterium]